jgi:regulator of replication initiation timing
MNQIKYAVYSYLAQLWLSLSGRAHNRFEALWDVIDDLVEENQQLHAKLEKLAKPATKGPGLKKKASSKPKVPKDFTGRAD